MSADEILDEVDSFLDEADGVYAEYEQGYMDADAALSRIRTELDSLEDALEQ